MMHIIVVFCCALAPQAAEAMQSPFFAVQPTSHQDLSAFTKWTSLMPRYKREQATANKNCAEENCTNQKWEQLLKDLKGKDTKEKLVAVNNFFNAITYIEDSNNFGMEDYWQTPYEFMEKGGDCEDYAIAKFISLKRLGISESMMRIMIVQDNNLGGIMHAVLEVRVNGSRFLLDNQLKSVIDQASIYHYRPIYAINGKSWWAYQ